MKQHGGDRSRAASAKRRIADMIAMSKVNPIQIQKFLKGVDYPARRADLLEQAEAQGADADVRSTLEQLPDRTYETPADVSEAVGKLGER